mgnify:CR=1 FL=1
MMLRPSSKCTGVFGCFIVSLSAATSPGTEKFCILQQPFRRLAECEGLESIADTTGTLDVHRCCDDSDKFSDLFGTSKSQGIKRWGWSQCRKRNLLAFSDVYLFRFLQRLHQVLNCPDCLESLFGDSRKEKAMKVLLIPPGPLMSTGTAKTLISLRTYLGLQRTRTSMMRRASAKQRSIFGCFVVLMKPIASPGAELVWLLQEPFRRLSEREDCESTADTTGTLGVHRCCDDLNKSSGLFWNL